MMKVFNAKLDITNVQRLIKGVYKITAEVIDNTGNFLATNVRLSDLIYLDERNSNSLYRYEVVKIYSETKGKTLVADIEWDIPNEEPMTPVTGRDCIIGRQHPKGHTIAMPSSQMNNASESLQTAVRNYEQNLLITDINNRELTLSNPTEDGQVLSSTKDGERSWVTLPTVPELNKGLPNGIAELDRNGKVPMSQMPDFVVKDVHVVSSEKEMLELTEANLGDIATRTDTGLKYILSDFDPTVIDNWLCLNGEAKIVSVNGKIGLIQLSTEDIPETSNLYYTDDRVANSPSVVELTDKINSFPIDALSKSIYDTNNDGIVDRATTADSIDYSNILNKPNVSKVAETGNYNDLINKPLIPSRTSDLVIDNLYTKDEIDNKLSNFSIPNLSKVATTGDYDDLLNRPTIPSNVSQLNLDTVYTKTEVDNNISNIINNTIPSDNTTYSSNYINSLLIGSNPTLSPVIRYETNGNIVLATGAGVTIEKNGNKAIINCPTGVTLISASIHFLTDDLNNATSCTINYGSSDNYDKSGKNTDYLNMLPPMIQVINDVEDSRAYRPACSFNYNINPHTVQVTGLLKGIGAWIRMSF